MYRDKFYFPVRYVRVSLEIFRLYPHLTSNITFVDADAIYQDSLTTIKSEYSKIKSDPTIIASYGSSMNDLIVKLDQIDGLLSDLKNSIITPEKFSVDYKPLKEASFLLIASIIPQL